MLPLRLVIDTNVLVSAALKRLGLERTLLTLAITKPARLSVSGPIMVEYARVLSRPEVGIRRAIRQQMLQLLKNRSFMIRSTRRLDVCGDPDDNVFLECADAARADFLITGNHRHFPPFWKMSKIINAREFMNLAAPHLFP